MRNSSTGAHGPTASNAPDAPELGAPDDERSQVPGIDDLQRRAGTDDRDVATAGHSPRPVREAVGRIVRTSDVRRPDDRGALVAEALHVRPVRTSP